MSWNPFGTTDRAMKMADNALGKGMAAIDALVFTNEEKSNVSVGLVNKWSETQETLIKETSARSVNRRWIAWGIVAHILLFADIAVVSALLGNGEVVKKIIEIATALTLGNAFIAVMIFYFGPHAFTALVGAIKAK